MTRDGDTLRLRWMTEGKRAFPMPVELKIDDAVRRVELPDGTASITVPASSHVVVDPAARILRRSAAVEEYQAWQREQRTRQ
jgi:hypothetical protein